MKNCKTCQVVMCPLRRGIKRLIVPELGKVSCEVVLLAVALCCKKFESQGLAEMPQKIQEWKKYSLDFFEKAGLYHE